MDNNSGQSELKLTRFSKFIPNMLMIPKEIKIIIYLCFFVHFLRCNVDKSRLAFTKVDLVSILGVGIEFGARGPFECK